MRAGEHTAQGQLPEPGDDVLTITMLGKSQSGKTTFILGMYAQLVHGVDGCFMHASEYDAGFEMYEKLRIAREGEEAKPTDAKPEPHQFVLTRGIGKELIVVDLMDFRGQAPFSLAAGREDGDTAWIRARLADSRSIFVALSAEHFTEPVLPGRLHEVREKTGADLFSDLINKTVTEAGEKSADGLPPSIAVLLTKADLIDGRPGSAARDWRELETEIREVLGAAFRPQLEVRIFPVSASAFAAPGGGAVNSLAFDLRGLADPLMFAAGCLFRVRRDALRRERDPMQATCDAARQRLEALMHGGPLMRWLRRTRIAEAQSSRDSAQSRLARLDDRLDRLDEQAKALLSRFDSAGAVR